MHVYFHKVNYYETDKMGITHHSNYIRWMEEARMDFLESVGFGMRELEAKGYASPVAALSCRYIRPTTYGDTVRIEITLEKYTGVKLEMSYKMINAETGAEVFEACSSHCFIGSGGRPAAVKKFFPEFDRALREICSD